MSSQIKNKRVAIITTWYPPVTGIAVNRMDSFANYLSEDFEIEVFCLAEKKETIIKSPSLKAHYFTSNKLVNKLKSDQRDSKFIHKIKTLLRILLKKVVKNPLNSWKNEVLCDLKLVHENKPFDAVLSSFSPIESHVVGAEFCKVYTDVPWIADMRDEMSKNPTIDTQTKLHLIEIEKLVNKYASAVISVSEPILNDFKIICPNISVFEEVRNGFDHLFLDQIPLKSESSILNFGYFGSFYGAQKPDVFFEALLLLNAYDDAIDFKINIFGAHNNFNIPLKLRDKINMVQGLPYDEAILKMKEMDANILIIPNNGRKGVYSGKLFDYISVQRPIIALLDKEDVAADLINEFKCGYVSDFKDVNEVFESLKELIKDKSEGVSKVATHDQVVSLHRKNQVIKLKDVINQLICK